MSKILIINGPNLNLIGEREQSQYGSKDYNYLKDICRKKSTELNLNLEMKQSNVEGEIDSKRARDAVIEVSETISAEFRDRISIIKYR